MMVILGFLVLGLSTVGFVALVRIVREWLQEQPRFQHDAKPEPECSHEWEPWSEPKDCDVEETTRQRYSYSEAATVVAKKFVGKFQERVCAKCNIYGRRWA